MIKVNLALKKHSMAGGGGSKDSSGEGLKDFTKAITRLDLEKAKESPLFKVVIHLGAAAVFYWLLQDYKEGELAKVDAQVAELQKKQSEITRDLGKLSSFDKEFQAIEKERQAFQTKLDLIQKLINDRNAPSRLLLGIATGIPSQIWLKDFKFNEKELIVTGSSLVGEGTGFDQITDFVSSLGSNAILSDVKLGRTQKEKDEKGIEVTTFDISAKRK